MHTSRPTPRSGFTLLELSIAVTILALMLSGLALFETANRRTTAQTAAVCGTQERAHRALERVLQELDGASIATLVPDPTGALGSEEVTFQRSAGVDSAGAPLWTTRTRIALLPDVGETLDGTDENGNGLVDERRLEVTYDFGTPDARSVTIAHGLAAMFPNELENGSDDNGNGVIDERGFNLQRVGNLLYVRLAMQSRGPDGKPVGWSANAALRLRN
jgi:prepilin-type N-terminal cleavage/methylation domain-containing protein